MNERSHSMPFWATTRSNYICMHFTAKEVLAQLLYCTSRSNKLQVGFVSTCFMCLSKTLLFKFDRTDKNMTLVGKSWMYYILRDRSILAESTVQTIKDQKVAVNATK